MDETKPVGCPWCFRVGGDCCRCRTTGLVSFTWHLLMNAWDVRGCQCATCRRLRAQRIHIEGRQP